MKNIKKILLTILFIVISAAALLGVCAMTVNNHVVQKEKNQIRCTITEENPAPSEKELNALKKQNADCILVLGCGIRDRETPTPMLADRLEVAVQLYEAGVAPKILATGDNGTVTHNEIHVMLQYLLAAGVPAEDIFCDHAGFSTYDSMYRAGSIFQVKRMIVVTQSYHMYRALYIAEKLGLSAVGAASDQKTYAGQPMREVREVAARVKDVLKCMKKPGPTYGGEVIPIDGDGTGSHGER
ncbi:MAG: YdcF family protein [Eubacterium sp.]|nr:YdcF family protein [Eubacterium sp.]